MITRYILIALLLTGCGLNGKFDTIVGPLFKDRGNMFKVCLKSNHDDFFRIEYLHGSDPYSHNYWLSLKLKDDTFRVVELFISNTGDTSIKELKINENEILEFNNKSDHLFSGKIRINNLHKDTSMLIFEYEDISYKWKGKVIIDIKKRIPVYFENYTSLNSGIYFLNSVQVLRSNKKKLKTNYYRRIMIRD